MRKSFLVLGLVLVCSKAFAFDVFGVDRLALPDGCVDKKVDDGALQLSDLIEIGVCQNPDLRVGYMGVKSAESAVGVEKADYLPNVSLTGGVSDTYHKYQDKKSVSANPLSGDVALSWLLYDFGGRSARMDQAVANLQAMRFSYNGLLNDTVLAIHNAYFDLLSAKAVLKSATDSAKTFQKSAEESARKYELGLSSLSDKLLAKTSYEQATLDVVTAKNGVNQAQSALAVLLNVAPTTVFNLKEIDKKMDIIPLSMGDMSLDKMIELAQSLRPEIKAQENKVQSAYHTINAVKSNAMPKIAFNAGAGYNDDYVASNPYGYNASVGVNVSVPLFTGFSDTYQIKKAGQTYKQEQYVLTATQDDVKTQVFNAYHDYQTAVSSYTITKQALKSAKENEKVSFASYQVGQGDILTLLTASSQLSTARKEVILAYFAVLKSKAILYRAIGQF